MVQISYPSMTKDILQRTKGNLLALLHGLEGRAALHIVMNGITTKGEFLDFSNEKPEKPDACFIDLRGYSIPF